MRATRILHASVNVHGSLDATTAFYADLLSLPSADRPVIPGVEGVYDRYEYLKEKHDALLALAGLIDRILKPPAGKR